MTPPPGTASPRVAYYTIGWPPSHLPSGIATYVANLRVGLQALGAESCVLASSLAEDSEAPDVIQLMRHDRLPFVARCWEWVWLRMQRDDFVRQALGRSLARAVNRLRRIAAIDLVEVEESHGFASVLQRRIGIPTVIRLHGPWFLVGEASGPNSDAASRLRIEHEGQAIRSAAAISAPSRLVLRQVCEHYGITPANAAVIPNAGPHIPQSELWQAAECEPETILYVGRFDTLKGGDLIVDAFARLAAKRPRAKLLFVGPDKGLTNKPGEAQTVADYVANTVRDPDTRSRILMLGQQPPAAIAILRRRAAVTVVCSRYETLPMTVIEAMAFGCPLVATAVGGIPELTAGEKAARLVPPDDASALADAIQGLLQNPDGAARLAADARQEYLDRLAPTAVARSMIAFYKDVVARWEGRGQR